MSPTVSIEESVFEEPVVVRVRCSHWIETELILTASYVADVFPELRQYVTDRVLDRWQQGKPCDCTVEP